ncbi:MAG: hypothetical protein WDM90_23405 [Ferruginibacter sp.]
MPAKAEIEKPCYQDFNQIFSKQSLLVKSIVANKITIMEHQHQLQKYTCPMLRIFYRMLPVSARYVV